MKTFFDSIFIGENSMDYEPDYPMKLEYYKIIEMKENVEKSYGIEVVKTEFREGKVEVENEKLSKLTKDQSIIEQILITLRDNKVTPFGIQDILNEGFIQL